MPTTTGASRRQPVGQILLARALSCLECGRRLAGTTCCPRWTGEAVWPLAEWRHPARPDGTGSMGADYLAGGSYSERDPLILRAIHDERHAPCLGAAQFHPPFDSGASLNRILKEAPAWREEQSLQMQRCPDRVRGIRDEANIDVEEIVTMPWSRDCRKPART
jgi:hypothetical protein